MKIAVVWDWVNEPMQIWGWQDGIAAMICELGKKAEVKIYTQMTGIFQSTIVQNPYFPIYVFPDYLSMQTEVIVDKPDVVLFWADMTRPAIPVLTDLFPSGILFAGGDPLLQNVEKFKVIFTESRVYTERLEIAGYNVVQAFGTNTELFKPKEQSKMFDVFFPACFAAWKRHELFAESVKGLRAMACGWFQEHEPWCYESCQKAGVFTIPHVTSHLLPDFYNASEVVLITSDSSGGSQRSVLEAMACNVPCIVMEDSDKTTEYIKEAGYQNLISPPIPSEIRNKVEEWRDKTVNTREWVLQNYSEYVYADKVYTALCKLVS